MSTADKHRFRNIFIETFLLLAIAISKYRNFSAPETCSSVHEVKIFAFFVLRKFELQNDAAREKLAGSTLSFSCWC
jgi:hypothetical protein